MLLSQDGLGVLPYTVPMLPAMLLFVLSTWAGPALQAVAENWAPLLTSYPPSLVLFQGITQWAEEPGWRGFALPRLEERFGPVRGSLLLGLLHGLWHLPVFVYSGGPVPLGPFDPATFALNTALVAVMTILWSWVYNNTGGSILLAVLLHSSFNASGSLIGQLIPSYPDAAVYLVNGAFVLIPLVLVVLTRGGLSYRGLSTWNAETVRGTEDPGREPL